MTNKKEHNIDSDPIETKEWVDSLKSLIEINGPPRAHFILENLIVYH